MEKREVGFDFLDAHKWGVGQGVANRELRRDVIVRRWILLDLLDTLRVCNLLGRLGSLVDRRWCWFCHGCG